MEKKEFLRTIRYYRKKLNIAKFVDILIFSLLIGAFVGILFQLLAFIIPLYWVNVYSLAAVVLAILTAVVWSFMKRRTMKEAALVMDGFGFKERIVTAYENLEKDGTMVMLQRKDAMEQLQRNKERIHIMILPSWKKLTGVVSLLILMIVLSILPSATKERAKELFELKEIAKEKQEEIEEVLEEMEKLEELASEELSPEQLAALQDMMEALQASMQEYEQAANMEELGAAEQKLEYKYENMSAQMSDLASMLESGAEISPLTAEAMESLAEQMQEMSGNQQLASGQGENNKEGQNGQGDNQGQGAGQNQGDGQGQGTGDGQGQGQGQTQGQGDGSGEGDGQGQGDGSSQSQGQGSGSGRGEGSSDMQHDYVSIPNSIVDSGNLSGNAQNHDNSDFFKTQNGISWEGNHVPYEEVIGKYQEHAYEGISTGQYPSGMEDIIKDYFSSFN